MSDLSLTADFARKLMAGGDTHTLSAADKVWLRIREAAGRGADGTAVIVPDSEASAVEDGLVRAGFAVKLHEVKDHPSGTLITALWRDD